MSPGTCVRVRLFSFLLLFQASQQWREPGGLSGTKPGPATDCHASLAK